MTVKYYVEFRQPVTEAQGLGVECAIYEETDSEIYVNIDNTWMVLANNRSISRFLFSHDSPMLQALEHTKLVH